MRYLYRILFPLLLVAMILSACSRNAWVERHNVYRCMHGVNPLEWDSTLAEVATWRAKNCQNCDHCVCEQNDPSCNSIHKQAYAENATCYAATAEQAVDDWYSEINNYDYNNPQWNNSTGHFINVIVSKATKVGCACNTNQCYCDYDHLFSAFPPKSQELMQIVTKPIKTLVQCTNSTP